MLGEQAAPAGAPVDGPGSCASKRDEASADVEGSDGSVGRLKRARSIAQESSCSCRERVRALVKSR